MLLTAEQAAKRLAITPRAFRSLAKRRRISPSYSWVGEGGQEVQVWSDGAVDRADRLLAEARASKREPSRVVEGMLPLADAAQSWARSYSERRPSRILEDARRGKVFRYEKGHLVPRKIGGRWYVGSDEFEKHCRAREEYDAAEAERRERELAEWERGRPERERLEEERNLRLERERQEASAAFWTRVERKEFTEAERERGFACLEGAVIRHQRVPAEWACAACGGRAVEAREYHPCTCHLCEDWFGCRDDSGSWVEVIVTCSACGSLSEWRA